MGSWRSRTFSKAAAFSGRAKTLNIAVLGRFKAGKSSFLNHLIGRPLLPVGVIPVTSVVTEIQWGPEERAEILFADGRRDQAPLDRIGDFISESHNPQNSKQVARVRVSYPRWIATAEFASSIRLAWRACSSTTRIPPWSGCPQCGVGAGRGGQRLRLSPGTTSS